MAALGGRATLLVQSSNVATYIEQFIYKKCLIDRQSYVNISSSFYSKGAIGMKKKYESNLKSLEYSPATNPLWKPMAVTIKAKKRGSAADVVSIETGEVTGCAIIRRVEQVDDEQFVKVFSAGVAASFDLTKTAQRVFQIVLEAYQSTPMSGGYAESVRLFWFGDGLDGKVVGLSKYTFNRGMRELLDKGFLAPRSPNEYWVNPHLFFRGDRVMFAREYRRTSSVMPPDMADRAALEKRGQQRLVG